MLEKKYIVVGPYSPADACIVDLSNDEEVEGSEIPIPPEASEVPAMKELQMRQKKMLEEANAAAAAAQSSRFSFRKWATDWRNYIEEMYG